MIAAKGSLYFTTPFHSYRVLNNIMEKIIDLSKLNSMDFTRFDLVECEVNTTDNTTDFNFYVQINFELKVDENLLHLLKDKENDFKLYIVDRIKQYTEDMDFKYKYMDNFRFDELFDTNNMNDTNDKNFKEVCNNKRTIFILNEE